MSDGLIVKPLPECPCCRLLSLVYVAHEHDVPGKEILIQWCGECGVLVKSSDERRLPWFTVPKVWDRVTVEEIADKLSGGRRRVSLKGHGE